MSRRVIVGIGGLGLAGAGYYLYTAGGDPEAAKNKAERDASRVSAQLKGGEQDATRKAESIGRDAGAKLDQAAVDAKAKGKDLQGQFEDYKTDAEKRLDQKSQQFGSKASKAVESFDKGVTDAAGRATDKVSEATDKAQSSIWNIFGGSGKK